uniref:Uncharacterized protein n=1 Tax=Macrostomum lignano TaxID=282301 RepID=A0A1I8FS95_9PLAT
MKAEKKQASSSVPAFQEENDTEARNEEAGDRDEEEEGKKKTPKPVESRINVDFPLIRADLGKEIYFVKMPNFLTVDTRPFDPPPTRMPWTRRTWWTKRADIGLRLRVENTIRWRRLPKDAEGRELTDEAGQPLRESNAKMVRWSRRQPVAAFGRRDFRRSFMDTTGRFQSPCLSAGLAPAGPGGVPPGNGLPPHTAPPPPTHKKITRSLQIRAASSTPRPKRAKKVLSDDEDEQQQDDEEEAGGDFGACRGERSGATKAAADAGGAFLSASDDSSSSSLSD